MLLSLAATAYSQSAVRQSALPTLSSVVMSARDIGVKELDTEELSTAVLTSKLDACSQRVAELEAALELNARVAEAQLTAEREAAKAVQEADAQLIAKLGSSRTLPAPAQLFANPLFQQIWTLPRLVCVLTTLFLTVAFNTIITTAGKVPGSGVAASTLSSFGKVSYALLKSSAQNTKLVVERIRRPSLAL